MIENLTVANPALSIINPRQLRPSAVLFGCSMNVIRSPMAAALTRRLFPNEIYARSAGVHAGTPDFLVQEVMAEIGVDVSTHEPRTFEDLIDGNFDLIVTMAPEAHHRALELTRTLSVDVEYWPTEDPSAIHGSRSQILNAYRAVRDRTEQQIKERFHWSPISID